MPQPADHEKSAVEVEARSLGISVEAFSGCLAMFQECLTAVGFEPTQLALVELESTPLDHSGKLSYFRCSAKFTATNSARWLSYDV